MLKGHEQDRTDVKKKASLKVEQGIRGVDKIWSR